MKNKHHSDNDTTHYAPQCKYLRNRYFFIYQQGSQIYYYDSFNNQGKGITKMHLIQSLIAKGWNDDLDPIKEGLEAIRQTNFIPINLHYDFYRPDQSNVVHIKGHCFPNLWRKPEIEPDTSLTAKPFIDHLTKMMGTKKKADYLIDMIAYRYQKGYIKHKPHIAFYLYGDLQGMGKSLLADTIAKIFGVSAVTSISDEKDLESMSSIDIWRRTWLIAEETSCKIGSKTYKKIKSHTGSNTFNAARKGEHFASYEIPAQIIMLSNHAPTFLESGDRRFFISKWQHTFETSESKDCYFKSYTNWLQQEGGYAAIAGLLNHRDISNVQLEAPAMITLEKEEILTSITDPVVEEMKLIMSYEENKTRQLWTADDFKTVFDEHNIKASQIPHKFREAGLHTSGAHRYKPVVGFDGSYSTDKTQAVRLRFYVKEGCRIEHIKGSKPIFKFGKGKSRQLYTVNGYNDCIVLANERKVAYRVF